MKKVTYLAVFMVIIFLAGCSNAAKKSDENSGDALANIKKAMWASVERPNSPAPEFSLNDINGNVIQSTQFKGKPYIVQGFTFGCNSCEHEIAELNKVHAEFGDKINIISLDVSGDEDNAVRETKQKYNGGDWIWASDTSGLGVKFGMKSTESTFLVDKSGIIVYADHILSDAAQLSEEIKKVV